MKRCWKDSNEVLSATRVNIVKKEVVVVKKERCEFMPDESSSGSKYQIK